MKRLLSKLVEMAAWRLLSMAHPSEMNDVHCLACFRTYEDGEEPKKGVFLFFKDGREK